MIEVEEEAGTLLGKQIVAFGYQNGCVVITVADGREVVIGADDNRIWWRVDSPILQ